MKRLIQGILFLILIQVFVVGAYDMQLDSFSESEIVLALTDLNTVDVKVSDMKATVESTSISDTYVVDASLERKGEEVFVHIDVSPIFEDYSSEQIQSITVSGMLEIDGEEAEFGKRVPIRTETSNRVPAAAPKLESSTLLSLVLGICILLVILILVIFFKKPKGKAVPANVSKKKKIRKKKTLPKKKKYSKKKRF